MKSRPTSRRLFLKSAAFAAAVPAANVLGANETLNIAVIGSGGRARQLMKALVKVPGVRIAGFCDVWDRHLEEGRKLASDGAFTTKRYQDILDHKDIDAVLIGTPDHWH